MKLIVGLGNPGEKYARNRHNAGFMTLERIADAFGRGGFRKKFSALVCEAEIGEQKTLLMCPQTFYNEAGRAVQEAARFHKIEPADIIVFHDEIDLVPGKVRVKTGGGNAGNNGLRSISAHIGPEFVRVRIGIGHPGAKDAVQHYVLGDFPKADQDGLDVLLDAMAAATPHLVAGAHDKFQTFVAQKLSDFVSDGDDEGDGDGEGCAPRSTAAQGRGAAGGPESAARDPAAGDQGARPAGRHPAGERGAKRKTALADNLKRWLHARTTKDS